MIIPIRCFTCSKVLADKYRFYLREVNKKKMNKNMELDSVLYLTQDFMDKTPEALVLDELGLNKYCCRRMMMTCVEID